MQNKCTGRIAREIGIPETSEDIQGQGRRMRAISIRHVVGTTAVPSGLFCSGF